MTLQPLPFLLNGLTPELENKAFLELRETPKVRNDALEEMKRLIRENSNFEPFMEDIFLLSFLRWKKYKIREAYEALYDFYILKKRHSRIFFDFTPSELKHVLEMNHLTTMPLRGPDGCNVGILRLGYHDFNICTLDELIATVLCMGLAANDIEAYQVSGAILILDCKNVSFKILKDSLNPYRVYFIVEVMRCFPGRIKSIHVVNIPYFFDIFYNMIKSLLPKKILKRLFTHSSDLTEFHKHVPPEILPEELGGTLGPMNNKGCIKFFLSKQHYVEQINNGGIKVQN